MTTDHARAPWRLVIDATLFAAALAFGALLRLSDLGGPSLWLDEILDYDVATHLAYQPWWRWLFGFASEHGSLFFATELAGRMSHSIELSARIAPALFGIATIAIGWLAARKLGDDHAAAPAFALLLAASPLHVYYSREARPYALLMLLATAMIALLLRGRSIGFAVAVLLFAAYTSAAAAPLLIAAAIVASVSFLLERDKVRRGFYAWYAVAAAMCSALIPLLYMLRPRTVAAAPFRFSARLVNDLLQSFSVTALDTSHPHRAASMMLLLAAIGALDALRRDRVRATVVIGMALLPAAIGIAALWRFQHWYSVRYVCVALPAYLLLVAIGIVALVRGLAALAVSVHAADYSIAVVLIAVAGAGMLAREGLSSAQNEPYQKLNWRVIASTIAHHSHDGDTVIASNDWSYVCLSFYLRPLPARVRLFNASESVSVASALVARDHRAWIVNAGFHRTSQILEWSCRFPVVLASPLESFRLHYAPNVQDLLEHRATAADERAFAARYAPDFTVNFGPEDDLFLTSGWYDAEGSNGDFARWAGGAPASLLVPADGKASRRISIRAMPFLSPDAPPQTMSISLNDAPVGRITFEDRWNTYVIDVPAERWREGVNHLSFAFSRAAAPSAINRSSPDSRILSAMFDQITITPADAPARTAALPELAETFRVNESDSAGNAAYLDSGTLWRGTKTRFRVNDFRRPAFDALLGRLGFDPRSALDLQRGKVRLEDLAATVAYDSDCRDDADFLRVAYATLFGRRIDSVGERYFLNALRHGGTRTGVVRGMVESQEFRDRLR